MDEENLSRAQVVSLLIEKISEELKVAHSQKYDTDRAELSAALCLQAQKELAEFLADAELLAKESKSEAARVEGERYFYFKENAETKLTDQGLKHMLAKDEVVLEALKKQFKAEADYNKWKNLFGVLRDGHVYYRSLSRGKSDF